MAEATKIFVGFCRRYHCLLPEAQKRCDENENNSLTYCVECDEYLLLTQDEVQGMDTSE